MSIRLEKVLSLSAGEYCDSVKKQLSDYHLKGVHARLEMDGSLPYEFLRAVPDDAEVVVNYRTSSAGSERLAYGVALISKR
jgi:hypothetical protein